jgi:hypothetical protein
MKIIWPLAALWLICSISAVSLAAGETIDLGPAHVSMDLNSLGSYSVKEGSPTSMDHHAKETNFKYTIYPATVTSKNNSSQVLIEIHEMSASELLDTSISRRDTSTGLEHCLEQSDIVTGLVGLQTKPYQINGHEGLLVEVSQNGKGPMYIAAYSPDEKDGSGKTVCVIGSDFPWETTKAIFDSLEVKIT